MYLSLIKKLGWSGQTSNIVLFFFKHKFVHILVIVITALLLFINLTTKTRAEDLNNMAQNTILADLIKSEFGDFEEDEQFIVESFDREATISAVQQTYLDNLSSVRVQPRASLDEEEDDEENLQTIQGGSTIVKPDMVSTQLTKRKRTENIVYTVKSGDSISTIAEEFEISASTIMWENNLSAYSIIRPGDQLTILPVSGITHKVTSGETLSSILNKYDIKEEDLLAYNKIDDASKLSVGQTLLIPGGKKVNYVQPESTKTTGYSAIKEFVKAPNAPAASGNMMNWPTEGHRITQYYSWRHYGLDIANKIGTPLYAADAGTVEQAGWGTGYGNQILIDHGGGKKTRYAHASQLFVKVGDKVSKGETIAAMGSTGWSTGPHLHFEVIINGTKYNPLNYIK